MGNSDEAGRKVVRNVSWVMGGKAEYWEEFIFFGLRLMGDRSKSIRKI